MTSTVNYICNNENGNEVPFLSFTYDDNGIRTSKTFEGVTTYYITANGNIMAQYQYDEEGNVVHFMEFLYDNNADIIGFTYNESPYFYIKNVQGEITNIVDENGADIASYRYSPHGESNYYCDETALQYGYTQTELEEIATANPIRYKGYYFDEELPFYYLQSRYYVPTWGRFLNADIPLYAQSQKDEFAGINLFVYCRNNPVNFSDPTGFEPTWDVVFNVIGISIIIDSIISGLKNIIIQRSKNKPRKDPRKKASEHKKTGKRERNVKHPNGEEHSRNPKGNRVPNGNAPRRITIDDDIIKIILLTIVVAVLIIDDVTIIGILDDALIVTLLGRILV